MNILKRRPKGQIMIITVLALPALLGALALTCDMAVMYVTWSNLQRAADAATLAGASALPDGGPSGVAVLQAQRYANANGIATSEIVSTTVSGTNQSLTMTAQRTVPHLFGRVVGLFNAPIQVVSIAAVKPAGPILGMVPLGIYCGGGKGPCNLVTTGRQGPGNWGFVDLDGTGGANLRTELANGASSWHQISDSLATETGCKQGDVGTPAGGLTQRLADAVAFEAQNPLPGGATPTATNFIPGDPRAVAVPIMSTDPNNWTGKDTSQVIGVEGLWLSGTDCTNISGTQMGEINATARPGGSGTCVAGTPCVAVLVPVAI